MSADSSTASAVSQDRINNMNDQFKDAGSKERITQIELKKFKECDNFKDLDRILNKYQLHSGEINKVNRDNIEIKAIFLKKSLKYQSYSQYEKVMITDTKNIRTKLREIIKYIYDSKKNITSKKYLFNKKPGMKGHVVRKKEKHIHTLYLL